MPTLQKLADNGLMYSQWHTTALCSPTRSTLLTGRNHHLNGMACITEGANGFPGAHGRIPDAVRHDRADPPGRRLEHLLAGQEPQRPRDGRRLGREPQAVAAAEGLRPLLRLPRRRDQPVVSRPRRRQPLHRAAVLARRRAITSPRTWPTRPSQMIRDQKASNPSKPWYMWFCPGANHAPHQAPAGIHRQVQGQVRRRLRSLPRVGPAAHDRQGHPAEGHPAHAAQPAAGRCGEPGRLRCAPGIRSTPTRRSCSRAWRRSTPGSRSTPTPRSAASSTTWRRPASSRTPSSSTPRTTARPAKAAPTARSTRTSSSTATRMNCPRT